MRRKGLHRGSLAVPLVLLACGGMNDAGSVADKFVDRYYVESDQDGALPLTTGHDRLYILHGKIDNLQRGH